MPGLDVDYLELRSRSLGPAPEQGTARLLVAAVLEPPAYSTTSGSSSAIPNPPIQPTDSDPAGHLPADH